MHFKFKRTSIAMAIAALAASPALYASEGGNPDGMPLDEHYSVNVENDVNVKLKKEISVTKDVEIKGRVGVIGLIPVFSSAMAVVDDKQINTGNSVENDIHNNNASAGDNVLNGASGNIGLNIAAGDNNMQDNAAALAAADAYFVFGSADAEVFVTQANAGQWVGNRGVTNNASLSGDALNGASGNIGVNIAAGNNNLQKNNLALAVAPSRLSEATVANVQRSGGNETVNVGTTREVYNEVGVRLTGTMNGTYSGISDQVGNLYVDNWNAGTGDNPHNSHPTNGSFAGHSDFDNQAQGAVDRNHDGGAFSFNEAGNIALSGSFSGSVVTKHTVFVPSENNATLSGNALNGASGNIGVNIAAGTGNLQNNSLAMAATRPALCTACSGGGNGGGE